MPPSDIADAFKVTDPRLREALGQAAVEDEPAPIRTLGDYLEADIKSPPELVTPRFLVRGGITATIADAGRGKTSLALNRVLAWAAGHSQFPEVDHAFVPTKPLRTLIIENEGAGGLFQEKIQTMLVKHRGRFSRTDIEAIRENVLVWGEGGYADVHLDNPQSLAQVRQGIEAWNPDVVLMEPFARLWTGDENSNTEMNALLSVLEDVAAKYDVAILVSHHKRKGRPDDGAYLQDYARGASALSGAATYMEFVKPVKGGDERELEGTKNRYDDPVPLVRMKWRKDKSGWYDYVPIEAGIKELVAILDPDEPRFVDDLAEELGEKQDRIRRLLKRAIDNDPPLARRVGGMGQGFGYLLTTDDGQPTGGPGY